MVARLVRDEEVVGSNPAIPTKRLTFNVDIVVPQKPVMWVR